MKKSILLLAAISLASCGSSGPGGSEPITLKLAPKQGDRFQYQITTTGGETETKMDVSVTIQKADPNKITTVAQLDSMLSNGKEPPGLIYQPLKQMRIYNDMDSTGKVLSSKTVDGPDTASNGVGANAICYPTKPVKVDDTWEGVTQAMGGKEVHAKYRLASVVDGLATIEVTPDAQPGTTLEGPILVKVEVSNGVIYSMAMKAIQKNPDGSEANVTMNMNRK